MAHNNNNHIKLIVEEHTCGGEIISREIIKEISIKEPKHTVFTDHEVKIQRNNQGGFMIVELTFLISGNR